MGRIFINHKGKYKRRAREKSKGKSKRQEEDYMKADKLRAIDQDGLYPLKSFDLKEAAPDEFTDLPKVAG